MGRAIVREPAVFLFDEPLSNLDAKLRVQMRLEIKQLQSNLGVTSLYVTHDQVEAMTMADRMVVMNNGITEQIGTPLEVYEHPQTLFAAQFIGSPAMNILPAALESGRITLKNGSTMPVNITQHHTTDVMVGIRPEHLYAADNGALQIEHGFSEPLGATTLLHGRLANSDQALTVSVPGVYSSSVSSPSRFNIAPEHVHLFDTHSGQCLS